MAGLLDFAAAQADTETVLRRDPNRMDMHRLLVDILYNRRDGDGLIAEADKIADLKDDALAHVTRGYGLLFKAKLPEARGEFDAAIAAKPSVPAYIARAVTHEKTQLDEALKDFDAAFKLQPDAQQVYLARASAYLAAGKDDLAIKDIDVLLKKAPDDAHLIKMRSYALVHDHKYAQAIGEMDKLLDKTPHDSVLLNDRCWYRAMWGKELEAALSDCDQSIKEKSSAASLDSRGLVYLRLGRFGDAVADYTEALKARPSQSTSLYGRGLAKLRNGATEAGLVDLKAARAVDEKIDAQFADFGLQP